MVLFRRVGFPAVFIVLFLFPSSASFGWRSVPPHEYGRDRSAWETSDRCARCHSAGSGKKAETEFDDFHEMPRSANRNVNNSMFFTVSSTSWMAGKPLPAVRHPRFPVRYFPNSSMKGT